jgi:4a-hydroxytetrahydrobiopterin dehydratase
MADTQKKDTGGCHACAGGQPALSEEEIQQEISSLSSKSHWKLSVDHKSISRSFVCKDWQAAMKAIQEISKYADNPDFNHHPDLHLTNYRNLEVKISTHSVQGLTTYDFMLAKAIDNMPIEYSPKWLRENS